MEFREGNRGGHNSGKMDSKMNTPGEPGHYDMEDGNERYSSHNYDGGLRGSSGDGDYAMRYSAGLAARGVSAGSEHDNVSASGRGMGSLNPRRVSTAARMPSMNLVQQMNTLEEPSMMDTGVPGLPGVAVGAMYDEESGAASNLKEAGAGATQRYSAGSQASHPAAMATSLHQQDMPYAVQTVYDDNNMTHPHHHHNAQENPYQNLVATGGHAMQKQEDPSLERARSQMANQPSKLPHPEAGRPQPTTIQFTEPIMPSSRLGRRILLNKPERQPDFVPAELSDHSQPHRALDFIYVECGTCGSRLSIPKSAVMVSCPVCDHVHPAASCRVK